MKTTMNVSFCVMNEKALPLTAFNDVEGALDYAKQQCEYTLQKRAQGIPYKLPMFYIYRNNITECRDKDFDLLINRSEQTVLVAMVSGDLNEDETEFVQTTMLSEV